MINSENLHAAIKEKKYAEAYRILTNEIEAFFEEKIPNYKNTQIIPQDMLAPVSNYNDIINSEQNISLIVFRLMHLYEKLK